MVVLLESEVRRFLLSSEDVTTALEGVMVRQNRNVDEIDEITSLDVMSKVVVAVVTHPGPDGRDEGR